MAEGQEPHPDGSSTDGRYPRRDFLRRAGKLIGAAAVAGPLVAANPAAAAGRRRAAATAQKLDVWYLTGSPEEIKYITALTERFGKGHGADTSTTPYDYDPINRALKLALSGHSGPDVAYANPSPDDQFVYQKNKWIVDLAPYVKKYGWTKRFNADVMNYWNEICCGGNTPRTGIPYDLVTVGWYYNPQIFAKHNLKPPTTMAQFQAVMAKLKANGVVPFAAGGLNVANPGSLHYVFEQLVHAIVPRATIQQLVLRNPNATWTDPGIVQALTISQQWAKAGYLEENALATSGADADSMFINGDAAMTLNGTWKTQQFLQATTFTPRFFATPRINLKQPWTLGGYSPNNQWMISSFASDKNLGAQYVDFMLGPKAAMTLWNNGDIPAFRFKHTPKPKSLVQTDVYQAMGKARTGFYLGVGGFFTTQYRPTLETLFNFSKTPQQVAQQLQENYLRLVNGG